MASDTRTDSSPMLSLTRSSIAFLLLSSSRSSDTCAFNSAIVSSFASRRASRPSLWDVPPLRTPNTGAMFSSLRCSIFGSVKHFWHIARKNFLLRKMLRRSDLSTLSSSLVYRVSTAPCPLFEQQREAVPAMLAEPIYRHYSYYYMLTKPGTSGKRRTLLARMGRSFLKPISYSKKPWVCRANLVQSRGARAKQGRFTPICTPTRGFW